MSTHADVRSLAQLQILRERLINWRGSTIKEAENVLVELNKISTWVTEEARAYWQSQLTAAERHWNECREALLRCEAAVRMDEKRPCTDERKRLERAKLRRVLCDEKLRVVREANLVWSRQLTKVRGRLQSVADMADADVQVAIVKLTDIVTSLEQYARIVSGSNSRSATETVTTSETPPSSGDAADLGPAQSAGDASPPA
ncbi:MAG: hypothetical protein U0892_08985 [Pirellulales bacterium]